MKKKAFALLSVLLLCVSMAIPVFAASGAPLLVDEADLLTDSEEEILRDTLNEISERQDMDVAVVTVNGLDGKTATAYTDDFYDYNGYAEDGVMLLVSISDREWCISTAGYGITAFTDAGLDYISDAFLDDLSNGYYYDAFETFAVLSDDFITQARTDEAYDVNAMPRESFPLVRNLLISIGVGFVIALIVVMILKGQLKSVRPQHAASEYVRSGSMEVTERSDLFLYRNVSKVRVADDSDSGGSSTHISSSGKSHGGSSGKF